MQAIKIIWVSTNVSNFIKRLGTESLPNETGGVLLGWKNETGFIVYAASGPGPKALHKPTRFKPDQSYRSNLIANWYNKTNGRVTYLGDWHTHPLDTIPKMSGLDKKELYRMGNFQPARLDKPLMAIIGLTEEGILKCWTTNKQANKWPWQKKITCIDVKVYSPELFSSYDLPVFN